MVMDQELISAQERLIRKREEAATTVQEDLGYQRNTSKRIYPLFPKNKYQKTLKESRISPDNGKIKVEYTRGIAYGMTHLLRRDIGEDLIKRGLAREI